MKKVIIASSLGNLLEWYDYTLYIYLSSTLALLFFPEQSKSSALMLTFAIFALGFLVRPLGGVFFGYLGDRFGRKKALTVSILMMALPTLLIGLTPTYATLGIGAPCLMVLWRVMQGLSVGGEYTTSILFLSESAPENRRGFAASFALVGAGFGWTTASLVSSFVTGYFTEAQLLNGGWRIPFLFGAFTALAALYVRKQLSETKPYLHAKKENQLSRNPLKELFKNRSRSVMLLIGVNMLSTIAGYFLYAYMPTYLHQELGWDQSRALLLNSWALLGFNCLVPFGGLLSDIYGRITVMKYAAISYLVLTIPLFFLINSGLGLFICWSTLTVLQALYHGALPAWMAEVFPVRMRATGLAFGYNIAASAFSGTCPLICALLIKVTGTSLAPAGYLTFASLVSITALYYAGRKELEYIPEPIRIKR